jgi:hypothetical protein
MNKRLIVLSITAAVTVMTGCGTTATKPSSQDTNTANSVDLQNRLTERESELEARDNQITELKRMLATQHGGETSSVASMGDLLPPNAKPGECYARVFIEPTYKTESVEVLKKEGYDVVNLVPAKYGYEEKTVLVKEATEILDVVPAVYDWKEEKVLVSPEIRELRKVPAVYGSKSEKVLVKAAHSIWKKGAGPISKVDESTGEIMCLVEVPAQYSTVTKRTLVTPATTKEVVVQPAQYKTVKTRIVKTPAKTVTKSIPAEYGTVKVKKLVTPASSSKTPVAPVYGTLTKRTKVTEGRIEWAPILCKTNMTGDIVAQLQSKLNTLGYNAGPVDSVYGWQTTQAVKKYQKAKNLAVGGLTIEVIKSLGITYL